MTRLTLCIGLAAALGVAAPGFAAQASAAAPPAATPAVPATTKATAGGAKAVVHPRSVRDARHCLRSTGSLIPPPKGQCLPVAGSSYSQQDLERTGTNDIGRALQMLDPSVTLGR